MFIRNNFKCWMKFSYSSLMIGDRYVEKMVANLGLSIGSKSNCLFILFEKKSHIQIQNPAMVACDRGMVN